MRAVFVTCALLAALSGCATVVSFPVPGPAPAPPTVKPVVLKLMRDADEAFAASDYVTAALAFERALRIEPHNALLWHRLAQVRVRQQHFHQAIQLASKSNTLTRDKQLRVSNWLLIAQAYEHSGKLSEADTARKKAEQAAN